MKINPSIAEIIGICVGDGCISVNDRYKELAITGDITEERLYYDKVVVPLFNKNIAIPIIGEGVTPKEYPKLGTYGFILFNKRIVEFMMKFGLDSGSKLKHKIPVQIMNASKETQMAFLRGLFDNDGTISFRKNYGSKCKLRKTPRIKLELTSLKVINDVKQICDELGFKYITRQPYKGKRDKNFKHGIEICRKDDIERWIKEIGFNSPKHLMKIEVWRKFGFCPPHTKIDERIRMLESSIWRNLRLSS